jgi:hypothetical protein
MMLQNPARKLGLRSFDFQHAVRAYQRTELQDRSPADLLDYAFGPSILRAFPHETPKQRYRNWSMFQHLEELVERLVSVCDQFLFDGVVYELGISLWREWGSTTATSPRGRDETECLASEDAAHNFDKLCPSSRTLEYPPRPRRSRISEKPAAWRKELKDSVVAVFAGKRELLNEKSIEKERKPLYEHVGPLGSGWQTVPHPTQEYRSEPFWQASFLC